MAASLEEGGEAATVAEVPEVPEVAAPEVRCPCAFLNFSMQ